MRARARGPTMGHRERAQGVHRPSVVARRSRRGRARSPRRAWRLRPGSARPLAPGRHRRGGERARPHAQGLRGDAGAPPRASRPLRCRRRWPGDRAGRRRPVAAHRRRRGGARHRDRLPDPGPAGALAPPRPRPGRGAPRAARVPQRVLHEEGRAHPRPRGPARAHPGAPGAAVHLGLRAPEGRARARRPRRGARGRPARRPGPRAVRARPRRDQPGGLGAAREGRCGRVQRGRLGGAAREDPLAAPRLPRDAAHRPGTAVLPRRSRSPRAAPGRGGAAGPRRRRAGPGRARPGVRHHAVRAADRARPAGAARPGRRAAAPAPR